MKKILFVLGLAILGFSNVNAQEVKVGVKGGINFSTLAGDNAVNTETVTSFHFGAVSEISISKKFSFQPELLYSGQGFSIANTIYELNYLNLPLIGKYYLTKGLSLEAGPQVGFLLSAKEGSASVKDHFKPVDFGANVGLGFKLENGLNFGARYNFGLTNVNDVSSSTAKNRNNSFQVSVGYFFF